MQESVQENVQAPKFLKILWPTLYKMNFEKNGLRHQLAQFLDFLSSLKVLYVGLQISEIGSKNTIFKK